jgi:hypothetical protein
VGAVNNKMAQAQAKIIVPGKAERSRKCHGNEFSINNPVITGTLSHIVGAAEADSDRVLHDPYVR